MPGDVCKTCITEGHPKLQARKKSVGGELIECTIVRSKSIADSNKRSTALIHLENGEVALSL